MSNSTLPSMLLQQLVSAICFFRLFLSLSPISNTLHSFIFNHLFISFIFDLIWLNLIDFFFQIFNKKSKYKNRTNFQLQQRHIDSTHLLLSLSLYQSVNQFLYTYINQLKPEHIAVIESSTVRVRNRERKGEGERVARARVHSNDQVRFIILWRPVYYFSEPNSTKRNGQR